MLSWVVVRFLYMHILETANKTQLCDPGLLGPLVHWGGGGRL